ncbi:hypothetical protein F5Y15DRAFT_415783 [Xylariaceae sp. FL0016]|nr:hypothetical protein F5Y15DRAFT_415783 [Xylariaceae sp. FL0016]
MKHFIILLSLLSCLPYGLSFNHAFEVEGGFSAACNDAYLSKASFAKCLSHILDITADGTDDWLKAAGTALKHKLCDATAGTQVNLGGAYSLPHWLVAAPTDEEVSR